LLLRGAKHVLALAIRLCGNDFGGCLRQLAWRGIDDVSGADAVLRFLPWDRLSLRAQSRDVRARQNLDDKAEIVVEPDLCKAANALL
jgi:hypothetical protein